MHATFFEHVSGESESAGQIAPNASAIPENSDCYQNNGRSNMLISSAGKIGIDKSDF